VNAQSISKDSESLAQRHNPDLGICKEEDNGSAINAGQMEKFLHILTKLVIFIPRPSRGRSDWNQAFPRCWNCKTPRGMGGGAGVLHPLVNSIWKHLYSAMKAERRVRDCFPDPPNPTSIAFPRGDLQHHGMSQELHKDHYFTWSKAREQEPDDACKS